MQDEFLRRFRWITELLAAPLPNSIPVSSADYAILSYLQEGWGKRDTAELLADLTAKFGAAAGVAVEKYLAPMITKEWKALGETEAHPGTEIDDFIRTLWQPLKESAGFDFAIERSGGRVVFCVTQCPIYDLARKTGLRQWLYHLACSTDFYSTPAFQPGIGFSRTKTLILDDEPCNHTYFYS